MTSTAYRIADTGLYLTADARLTSRVDDVDEIRDVSEAPHELITVSLRGDRLRGLPLLAAKGSYPDETVGHALSVLQAIPYVSYLAKFMEALGSWASGKAPDPMFEGLNRIHDQLGRMQDFAVAAWSTTREDNLVTLLAPAATALRTALDYLRAGKPRTDPVWAAKIASADRDSHVAVSAFATSIDMGFWMRPDSVALMSWAGDPTSYQRGWMPHLPDRAPRDERHRVWDHRWALPALTYTVAVRVVVLKAFSTGSRGEHRRQRDELLQYVAVLSAVFSRRWAGIVGIRALDERQRVKYGTMGHIPLAVADIYGGYFLAGVYLPSDIYNRRFSDDLWPPGLNAFTNRHVALSVPWAEAHMQAFAHHWWNLVALRTGIETLLLYISELLNICDEPAWATPEMMYVTTEVWKLREDPDAVDVSKFAAALADLSVSERDPPATRAVRTSQLFDGVRNGGNHAIALLNRVATELVELGGGPER